MMMNSLAQVRTETGSLLPIAAVFLAGVMLLMVSGIAQATALHDAAHDQRHAMAFPCH